MSKIVRRPLKVGKGDPQKSKRVRSADTGKFVVIRTVDADSKTFVDDLSNAFKSNVSAALRGKK
jgi:hypothetical protein